MPTTKKILVERILRILNGGPLTDQDRVGEAEVMYAMGAAIGRALKTQMFEVTYAGEGETIPEGSLLATYENIPVTRSRTSNGLYIAVAALPVTPMYLPERQGVFSVYPSGQPDIEFLPLPVGMINAWKQDAVVSPLNYTMYSWDGRKVMIYDDLVGAGIDMVDMKLAVSDIASLGDYDPLPIGSDMEAQVIAEVLQQYSIEPRTERKEDKQLTPLKGD